MNTEAAFLRAMQEHLDDASVRLVFADWLEERGDPRGELLRLLNTLTQSVKVRGRKKLEERLRKLVADGVKPVGPFFTNSIGMKFALVWPGTFMMGSPESEEERSDDEIQHGVTLTKGLWLGIHPVTQACWRQVMGKNPSELKGNRRPVEQVSWNDCARFVQKLRKSERREYRLPTEAEWEYACRSGTTSPYFFGNSISNTQVRFAASQTISVGRYPANAWGLHDMHGNVFEWCSDEYDAYPRTHTVDPEVPLTEGISRVMRGGSFGVPACWVRSASRTQGPASERLFSIGFRAAITIS